jgi:two-component system response regulator
VNLPEPPSQTLQPLLLVDDSAEELLLMQLGLKRAGVTLPQIAVNSGDEALDFLLGRGLHGGRDTSVLPRLTLMDLHMPGKSGLDVLREIRAHPRLSGMKVVMFSASDEPDEIMRAHDLGANSFICKPMTATGMRDVIRQIRERWLDVDLPVTQRAGPEPG